MPVKHMLAGNVAHHLTEKKSQRPLLLLRSTSRTRTLNAGARNLICVHGTTHVPVNSILLRLLLPPYANTGEVSHEALASLDTLKNHALKIDYSSASGVCAVLLWGG